MKRIFLASALLLAPIAARADFNSCAAGLRAEAARQGVGANTLAAAFDGLQADDSVLKFQTNQPEFKTPVWDYLATLVDDERVADGRAAMAANASALRTAEERYGVDRHIVAAFWGVESNFGTQMGKRSLVRSLATLACEGERAGYFKGELMATLKIADHGDVPLDKLNGSWAGAFGQTQFMPSTFLRLAVDLDGDGHRDIVDSAGDALGSTANFLRKAGWTTGLSWGFEVQLPDGYSGPSGRKAKQPMSSWAGRGIRRIDGGDLGSGSAGLLLPAGPNGPAFLVTRNFDVIYSYNPSESYALAIAILAQRLAGGPGIQTPWPTGDAGLARADLRKIQTLLSQKGYDIGEADGAIGEKSRQAIADFESKNGMPADGRPSRKVLEMLER